MEIIYILKEFLEFIKIFRSMAVSISFMFGRLGSIVGSNIVGALLEVNCNLTFLLYSGFGLGMFLEFI